MANDGNAETYDVFISYSRKDAERVREIVEHLSNFDLKIWFDRQSILHGVRIRDTILAGIRASSVVIVFISQHSLVSRWVLNELDTAMMREMGEMGEMGEGKAIVVPVILGRIEDEAIPGDLRGKSYLDLRHNFSKRWIENRDTFTQNIIALAKGQSIGPEAIVLAVGDPLIRYLASYTFQYLHQSTMIEDREMRKVARAFGITIAGLKPGDSEDADDSNSDAPEEDTEIGQATDGGGDQGDHSEAEIQRFLDYTDSGRRFVQRYGEFSLQQLVLFYIDRLDMDLAGGFSYEKLDELVESVRFIMTAFGLYFNFEDIQADSSHGILVRITKDSIGLRLFGDITFTHDDPEEDRALCPRMMPFGYFPSAAEP